MVVFSAKVHTISRVLVNDELFVMYLTSKGNASVGYGDMLITIRFLNNFSSVPNQA